MHQTNAGAKCRPHCGKSNVKPVERCPQDSVLAPGYYDRHDRGNSSSRFGSGAAKRFQRWSQDNGCYASPDQRGGLDPRKHRTTLLPYFVWPTKTHTQFLASRRVPLERKFRKLFVNWLSSTTRTKTLLWKPHSGFNASAEQLLRY